MIVIPMAGQSSRFFNEGYKTHKYKLRAHGKSLFSHAVLSFKNFFNQEEFLFIALDGQDALSFIRAECEILGIQKYHVSILQNPTKGQAETVYLGIKQAEVSKEEHILIFNIDTFRPNFQWPQIFDPFSVDGYLETFIGSGPNWSNIQPANKLKQTVELTAEKQQISEYCCTGIYYWRRCGDFCNVFDYYRTLPFEDLSAKEYYVAPMYNQSISEGKDIRYSVIANHEVIFCGIPEEYEEFLKYHPKEN